MRIQGWKVTGYVAVLLGAMIVTAWLILGFNEEFVRTVIRATARTSVVLFLLAFSAAAARAMLPSTPTLWLMANRRYLGVSFALAHFTHLAALVVLGRYFPHPFVDELQPATVIGGGLAYVLIALMTITSFAPARRRLGERTWKILHLSGSYYIWLIFLNSYLSRALHEAGYAPLVLALLAAAAIRIAFWCRRRRTAVAAAAT